MQSCLNDEAGFQQEEIKCAVTGMLWDLGMGQTPFWKYNEMVIRQFRRKPKISISRKASQIHRQEED